MRKSQIIEIQYKSKEKDSQADIKKIASIKGLKIQDERQYKQHFVYSP
jgi:hypothetical protein